eukprot:COSAG02_NODE_60229_length_272_cov_0.566474_1_plen_27_part_01
MPPLTSYRRTTILLDLVATALAVRKGR